MMRVDIYSVGKKNIYLQTYISISDLLEIRVDFKSPLVRVHEYYKKIYEGDFSYSYISDGENVFFDGVAGREIRNMLVGVANDAANSCRIVEFKGDDGSGMIWFSTEEYVDSLINKTSETLEQTGHIISDEKDLVYYSIWLYFFIQKNYFSGVQNIGFNLTNSLILMDNDFSADLIDAVCNIDPDFLIIWAKDDSYLMVRNSASNNNKFVSILKYFIPDDSIPSLRGNKNIDELKMVARSANRTIELNEDIITTIDDNLNRKIKNPAPIFIPRLNMAPRIIAHDILRYFNHELPELEVVAESLGINIVYDALQEGLLGVFVGNKEAHSSCIIINAIARGLGSQRFTIAHELGHYLMHYGMSFYCGYSEVYESNRIVEAQANEFASELLMPTAIIRRHVSGRKYSDKIILGMSKQFGVSIEAAARRFIEIESRRKLSLVVVKEQKIISIFATKINAEGLRWVGRNSLGENAVSKKESIKLCESGASRLDSFIPDADAEWLQDIDIDIHPFSEIEGYYLFLEMVD